MSKATIKKLFLVNSELVMGIKYQQNAAKFLTIEASFSVDTLPFRKGMNEVEVFQITLKRFFHRIARTMGATKYYS